MDEHISLNVFMHYNKPMKNIIDYIKEYGNLTLEEYPFNNVDSLILSQISYIKFENSTIDVESEVHLLNEFENEINDLCTNTRVPELNEELFLQTIHSLRYEAITISHLQTNFDKDNEKQFCAMTFHLPNQTDYIAFRGTDASFVGWKEDFNLSTGVVPAQKRAIEYLQKISEHTDGMLRVGGHSKGGNFAIYAGMYCEKSLRDQIIAIYNNDGPGFSKDVVASAAYQNLLPLITTIVPESSVVGRLFEHQEDYVVIKSENKGLKQHDAMSWEVLGNHFVHAVTPANQSLLANQAIREWIALIPREKRKEIVEAVFQILDAAGIETVDDFLTLKLKDIRTIIQTKKKLPRETSDSISDAAFLLIKIMIKTFTST